MGKRTEVVELKHGNTAQLKHSGTGRKIAHDTDGALDLLALLILMYCIIERGSNTRSQSCISLLR